MCSNKKFPQLGICDLFYLEETNKKLKVHWLFKTTHTIEQGKNPLLFCCGERELNQAPNTRCPSALDQEEGEARSGGRRQYLNGEQGYYHCPKLENCWGLC